MNSEIIHFIANYGYLALFLLIFSQEIGIPNPIPNELVLVYSGYLCTQGTFHFSIVILTAISADFIGTNILYFIFYFFGKRILKHKPKWFPISEKAIHRASERVSKGGLWAIWIGRITPFIRGYTSIIAGLLHIEPKKFLPIALISALCWSSVFVLIGKTVGNNWSVFVVYLTNFKFIILSLILVLLIYLMIRYYQKSKLLRTTK
jgi:membrane protein DedA with SNARE-associated domain